MRNAGLRRCFAVLVALFAVYQGVHLFVPGRGLDGLPDDVDAQRVFVRHSLDRGAPEAMQELFPEGWFFSWALYGLAEANIARARGDADALANARTALAMLDSEQGHAAFPKDQSPPHGIFYRGWTTLLRAELVELGIDEERPALRDATRMIEAAFRASPAPWLEAYPGMAWPCDSVVALAALATADHAGVGDSTRTIERWRLRTTNLLDPATGLFPHLADPASGARGTSQSIILRFLPRVAPDLAREQYLVFRDQFVVTHLGLPAVRERPDPDPPLFDAGDVDSGPLLLGVSLSASAVTIGTAEANGDRHLSNALRHAADVAGVPIGWSEKRYLFGAIPIADAFLLWAKTTPASGSGVPQGAPGRGWPIPLLVLDAVLVAFGAWLSRR